MAADRPELFIDGFKVLRDREELQVIHGTSERWDQSEGAEQRGNFTEQLNSGFRRRTSLLPEEQVQASIF